MLPIIRTFISLPAGVARMPFWRFTVLTALGCIPWVFMLAFIGKQAGDNWENWKEHLHYVDYAVVAAIVIGVVWLFVRYRRRRGGAPAADARPPELAQVAALGLIQGAAELLPVSSSAHVAAVPWLLGWEVRGVGAGAAQGARGRAARGRGAWRWRRSSCALAPDARTLALSLAPPVVVGVPVRAADRGALGGPALGARGCSRRGGARAAARPAPDAARRPARAPATRWRSASRRPRRSFPGVSRTGATLAAARALGYSRPEASRLSFGVAGPVLAGATALKALARAAGRPDARLAVGGARRVRGHARRAARRRRSSGGRRCGRRRRSGALAGAQRSRGHPGVRYRRAR